MALMRINTVIVAALTCACSLAAHSSWAQQVAPAFEPQIVVSGSADVFVQPSKASFSVGVTTSAQTSAGAAEENARISKSVMQALERAGLKRDEIKGSRLGVSPRWEYDDKGQHPKRSTFEGTNTIQIATENLAQVGAFIDAALLAGATNVSEIAFSAKDMSEARAQALAQAVVSARQDAEAIARAGGGGLGDLLLLSTERASDAPGIGLQEIVVTGSRRSREPMSTDVIPSQIKVSATVIARWRFVTSTADVTEAPAKRIR